MLREEPLPMVAGRNVDGHLSPCTTIHIDAGDTPALEGGDDVGRETGTAIEQGSTLGVENRSCENRPGRDLAEDNAQHVEGGLSLGSIGSTGFGAGICGRIRHPGEHDLSK